MNHEQFSRKSGLEINRHAREQEKRQNLAQAFWATETKPTEIQHMSGMKAVFLRLLIGLSALGKMAPAASKYMKI